MRISHLFIIVAVFSLICVAVGTTANMHVNHFCSPDGNTPPVAIDDNYTVHGSLILKPLLNDGDPDGDRVFFDGIATSPQHGELVGVNPGELSYTASAGYVGAD